jgi:hypothetical protein
MGLRAPAKWKKYHTGLFLWQLLDKTKKAARAALWCSLPLIARCVEAYAGRTIPLRAIQAGAHIALS